MNKNYLGSHYSMSYLPVSKKWMNLLNLFYKCQNLDIFKQYNLGCRCFDIHLCYKNNTWEFCNGIIIYKSKSKNMLKYILDFFNLQDEQVYVGLFLEKINTSEDVSKFIDLCKRLEERYSNIIFFGGCSKDLITLYYKFRRDTFSINICSKNYGITIIEKLIPYINANMNNMNIKMNECISGINLFDFINKGIYG